MKNLVTDFNVSKYTHTINTHTYRTSLRHCSKTYSISILMETEQVQHQEAASIHGDILEVVLSHVPLTDLVLASHVSNSWNVAVSSSLRYYNQPKPWLLYHTQTSRPPYTTTTHAYDPRSDVWIHVDSPSIKYVNVLRSSHSDLLYMLSPWSFSF